MALGAKTRRSSLSRIGPETEAQPRSGDKGQGRGAKNKYASRTIAGTTNRNPQIQAVCPSFSRSEAAKARTVEVCTLSSDPRCIINAVTRSRSWTRSPKPLLSQPASRGPRQRDGEWNTRRSSAAGAAGDPVANARSHSSTIETRPRRVSPRPDTRAGGGRITGS